VFRSALLILSGNATASLLLLARNLIVARFIPVEDYGIAATFAVAMAMVEMASAFGLQQQIIQSKEGDDHRFQAALHGFQLLRGVGAGVALFLIANPIARFLDIPEVAWAYQLLALVPVIKACEHFDVHRFSRQMRFWPLILTGSVPALLSLLAAWPLAIWLGDWRVMLYAILAQISFRVLTSHLVAERPYHLIFDRAIMRRSLRFGWPILTNSILLFLVFQGDKLIVGRALGMEALAIFAMGMTLTLTPTMVIAKSAQNFFLPQLSAAAGTPHFGEIANCALQMVTSAALVFLAVVFIFGGPVLHILFGEKYASLTPLLIWFGIGQTLRVLKAGPAIVALSLGHTENAMNANLIRVFALPLIWIVANNTGSILYILFMVVFSEILSAMIAFYLLARKSNLNAPTIFLPQIPGILAVGVIGFWVTLTPPSVVLPGFYTLAAVCLGLMMVFNLMPAVRKLIWPCLRK